MATVTVMGEDTYTFTHGRKPRGRAVWLFARSADLLLHDAPTTPHEWSRVLFQYSGTYTDAKRAARKWAAELGSSYVRVMP